MRRREEPIPALSSGMSHIVLTGLLLAVALTAPPRPMQLEQAGSTRPTPAKTPAGSAVATPGQTPATSNPDSGTTPTATAVPPPDVWSEHAVTLAREQCNHLLSGVSAEVEFLEPIKKGQCGLPAPVRLKSVGSGAQRVTFNPPVQVNCRMVAALASWTKSTLQPEARTRFGSEVKGILGASGYVCRNIYHRPVGKLSQHALANAVDIGAFSLANGRTIRVLRGWGLTARDIKAQAEARAKAETKAKAAQGKDKTNGKAADETATESKTVATVTSGKEVPRGTKQERLVTRASLALSGDKVTEKAAKVAKDGDPGAEAKSTKPTKEALFLRAIHGGACGEFGTVLGPEANDPHRDHFHLDLIARQGRGYCR